jgi:hypothetical protein
MLEVAPTSIQSQKGMRTQHPSVSRSRRDTPSIGAERKLMFEVRCFRFCPFPAIAGAWRQVNRQVGLL